MFLVMFCSESSVSVNALENNQYFACWNLTIPDEDSMYCAGEVSRYGWAVIWFIEYLLFRLTSPWVKNCTVLCRKRMTKQKKCTGLCCSSGLTERIQLTTSRRTTVLQLLDKYSAATSSKDAGTTWHLRSLFAVSCVSYSKTGAKKNKNSSSWFAQYKMKSHRARVQSIISVHCSYCSY